MKFCERPWTMFYLINANEGEVWPCAWLDSTMKIGNILEQSVDEILQSKKLKKLRDSILDGSFRYCDCHQCAFLANNSLPELSQEEINQIIQTPFPNQFNLAYDETCNHACPSCRSGYFIGDEAYYEKVQTINKKMLPYYNKATFLSVNGRGDFFACKHLLSLIKKLRPEREDFSFAIETNAALFDQKHWEQISHMSKYHIRVIATVNSFHDSTYRYLNGYANHVDKVLYNLKYISSLRKQNIINEFQISIVVQESNFRELPEYVERCLNEFQADFVRIRGIMQFSIPENEFWIKDVFNPAHPFYKEAIDILNYPIMKDPRVWYWEGDYENVRKPREMPLKRFEQYYNMLWKMCELDDKGELEDKFSILKDKQFVLYGAGHLTEFIVRKMQKFGISPFCIYDKNRTGNMYNIPIFQMNFETKLDEEIEIVVNTLSFYDSEIKESFCLVGYHGEWINLEEVIFRRKK